MTPEDWIDDVRAVMDAVGVEQASLVGTGTAGTVALLLAASHPDRVSHLVLVNATARTAADDDYPFGSSPELRASMRDLMADAWGRAAILPMLAPELAGDDRFRDWYGRFERLAASPGMALVAQQMAARLGDHRWAALLDDHNRIAREEFARSRGHEVDAAGDGFLATFDGPARAIRCARAIRDALRAVDLEIRAGLHTGEVEARGEKVIGIGVHIGARVMASAERGEILVSRTVVDLVSGSGITFRDRGLHSLKGIEGAWQLFAVGDDPSGG